MKRSKILATILAVVLLMVTALPLSVFAASDASITVIPPAGLSLTASDFTAYRLFDVLVSTAPGDLAEKNYAYRPYGGTTIGVDDFVTQFLAKPGMATKYGATWQIFRDKLEANSLDLTQLTYDLEASGIAFASKTGTLDDPNVVFTGLDYGYYLVVGKGKGNNPTNHDGKVVAFSSLITVDSKAKSGTIKLKADAPFITKQVWNHNIGASDKWDDWTDVNMGNVVDFKLTSRVPVMTGYKSYTFIVHDTMSDGLTFDPDSVEVRIGGTLIDNDDADDAGYDYFYKVVTVDDEPTIDPDTFQIVFDPDWFVTQNIRDIADVDDTGDQNYNLGIVITYSAELNKDAVIGAPGNPNTVYLEYSSNPYSTTKGNGGTTEDTPEDGVIVYTFDLDILKYDGRHEEDQDFDPTEYPLKDAEFELRTGSASGSAVRVVPYTTGGYNYRLVTDEDTTGITTTLVSATNGKIKIKGLDAGVYYLVETKAPEGYNDGFVTKITITHDDDEGAYTVWVEMDVDGDDVDVDVNKRVDIANLAGSILPGTGGIGKTVVIFGGLALIGICAAALVVYKKRRALSAMKA